MKLSEILDYVSGTSTSLINIPKKKTLKQQETYYLQVANHVFLNFKLNIIYELL